MTDQKTPESPQERPEGGSAVLEAPEGQNGPQAGVQGFTVFERVTPTEHCGDLMPAWVAEPRSECVLRPGHSGSHADDRGARWWCETEDIDWRQRATQTETRLRLAHQARRTKEHQLDDIRRALCDIGFMDDDDPYSHADLADVIRQNSPAPARNADPTVAECAEADRLEGGRVMADSLNLKVIDYWGLSCDTGRHNQPHPGQTCDEADQWICFRDQVLHDLMRNAWAEFAHAHQAAALAETVYAAALKDSNPEPPSKTDVESALDKLRPHLAWDHRYRDQP